MPRCLPLLLALCLQAQANSSAHKLRTIFSARRGTSAEGPMHVGALVVREQQLCSPAMWYKVYDNSIESKSIEFHTLYLKDH